MMSRLLLSAVLMAVAAVLVRAADVQLELDHPLNVVLAEVDSQVEAALRGEPDVKKEGKGDKEKEHAEDNVKLKNALDLKTITVDISRGEAKEQPASAIAAFASIAWEAIQRGEHAVAVAQHNVEAAKYHMNVENHDLKAWVENQKNAAQHQITQEENRIGKLSDEISHLQHVFKDAVAKSEAYRTQTAQLVTERQLQSSPPLMPAVAAAALTDQQYQSSIDQLNHYAAAAKQIMKESADGIKVREHLVTQATEWVKKSKDVLKGWEEQQTKIIAQRMETRTQHLKLMEAEYENFKNILKDATNEHTKYQNALQRANIAEQIKALKAQKTNYEKVKTVNEYDKAKMASFLSSIDMEVTSLEEQLKKFEGDDKVAPPPAAWGVLSGFHPPLVQYPAQAHYPAFPEPPRLGNPSLGPLLQPASNLVPTNPEAGGIGSDGLSASGSAASASGSSASASASAEPKFRAINEYPETQHEQGGAAVYRRTPTPPLMPELPTPPNAKMAALENAGDYN